MDNGFIHSQQYAGFLLEYSPSPFSETNLPPLLTARMGKAWVEAKDPSFWGVASSWLLSFVEALKADVSLEDHQKMWNNWHTYRMLKGTERPFNFEAITDLNFVQRLVLWHYLPYYTSDVSLTMEIMQEQEQINLHLQRYLVDNNLRVALQTEKSYDNLSQASDDTFTVQADLQAANAELARMNHELAGSRHFIQHVTDSVPNAIYIFDLKQFRTVYVNHDILNTLGYTPEQVFSFGPEIMKTLIHPDDFERRSAFYPGFIAAADDEIREVEFRLKHANGQYRYFLVRGKIFNRNAAGVPSQVIGISQDITQLKEREQELKETLKQLKETNEELVRTEEMLRETTAGLEETVARRTSDLHQKNQELQATEEELRANNEELRNTVRELDMRNFELDQFVYKVSHDLRSPLTSVLGLIQLLKMTADGAERLEYILLIENRTIKLDQFIRSMLDYSRNNRLELVNQAIDFEKIITDSIEQMEYVTNFARLRVDYQVHKETEFVSDALRLRIILTNLIANAYKYQDTTKPESVLRIAIWQRQSGTEILLEDNGIGIRPEYLSRVFDMFFRASDKSEGSGLGLYIVKQIVERLNGYISIKSQIGQGTQIRLVLPSTL